MTRRYLVAIVALVALGGGAILYAARTDPSALGGVAGDGLTAAGRKAPDLRAKGWLNSAPLTARDLEGKVVLYDFWTYSCVNCVRTLPYVRSWYERYHDDGLVVVGVHSPEFDFEHDHGNVADACRRLHVTWPVAFDDDLTIWDDFSNRYWPAKYVADRSGDIRFTHFGEGNYGATENALRKLLGVAPSSPRAASPGGRRSDAMPDVITPETYLGTARGLVAGHGGPQTFPEPKAPAVDQAVLAGPWDVGREAVKATGPGAAIVLHYRAREVNLVLAAPSGGADVALELDGKPLPPVHVNAPDMYRLIRGTAVEEHVLRVSPSAPGVQAFAFTFG